MMARGRPVVLTADRILMADYDLLFDGMLAASQTTTTPGAVIERLLAPHHRTADGRARVAPMGLRRIEAALAAGGLGPDDVAVV
ncbi:MAG TPA: radical SAM protein, partial [Armatimonadota bacterium]|nr:radical SAM protein [Armatimonadota bacterium]